MKYSDYLEQMEICPFCENVTPRTILENEDAFLTCAFAPYHKYHLMVIPKRHVQNFSDLSRSENVHINLLLVEGTKLMNLVGIENCNIFIRDGHSLGKSIKHIHFHVIPDGLLECSHISTNTREFVGEEEGLISVNNFKAALNKGKNISL